jgi:hypothetical protein
MVQYECIQEQKLGQAGTPMRVPEFPFFPPNSGKKTQMKRRFAINTWSTYLIKFLGSASKPAVNLYLASPFSPLLSTSAYSPPTSLCYKPTILQLLGCVPRQLSRAHFRVKMLSGCIMSHGKCHRRFCTFSFVDR